MRRATALVLGLALTLAACGSKADATTVVREASTKTAGGHSAHMAVDIKVRAKTGNPQEITGDGVFDFTKKSGLMQLKLPQFAGMNLGAIEVRVLDSIIYEKLPPQLASAAGQKGWVKIDPAAVAKLAGFDVSALAQTGSSDPTQFLDLLKSVSSDVTEVGTAKVGGVDTTHYRATIDFAKSVSDNTALDAATKAKLSSFYNNLSAPADVWIDGNGRLRKMTYTLDTSKIDASALSSNPRAAASLQQIAGIDFTLELSNFGVPVSVTAPPANETTDLSSLTGGTGLG
jgi:hypothetical protein